MGHNDHIEETPLFYMIEDKQVCSACIHDPGLLKWFFNQPPTVLNRGVCDYCKKACAVIAIEQVQRHILKFFDLTNIEDVSPRNDGEWLLKETTPEDWMHVNLVGALEDEVVEDFFQNAVDQWYCRYDWQLLTDTEQWKNCWELYCTHVQECDGEFEVVFEIDEDEYHTPDFVHPRQLPERACVALLKADAFSIEPRDSLFYRVREEECDLLFSELTSAPDEYAGANRFSLPGESMFYGAPDHCTSALEIGVTEGQPYSIGSFKTSRELVLLDIPRMKMPEGRFDPQWEGDYHIAEFLKGFARDVSKPIQEKDKDFEYLPTQAFCRYVKDQCAQDIARHYINYPAGVALPLPIALILKHGSIDGIRYQSSKDAKECAVLFCDREVSKSWFTLADARHAVFGE